jgi:hypothetical protein
MVDEESQDVASEPVGGAPGNRDKRRGALGVIEGEAASHGESEAAPLAAEVEEPPPPDRATGEPAPSAGEAGDAAPSTWEGQTGQPGRRGPRPFVSGALGGLVVSALVGAAGYYLLAPKANLAEADAGRLAAIESLAQRENAAIADIDKRVAGIDKRVGALEGSSSTAALAAVDKRLGALQSANAEEAPKIAAATQSVQNLTAQVQNLVADINAAQSDIPALQARVAKLESAPSQPAAADLSAVNARLDKIEAQLAALQKPSAGDNSAAVAIVAESLHDKLVRGAAFKTELEGLESLGVEPAKLAALKAVADGAPTDSKLAADFEAVRSKVLAAAAPPEEHEGAVNRFLSHFRGLVQIRDLNGTTGDDPLALVARIEADSRRGDLSDALAAFAKLPEPSRRAAAAWASAVEARQAAATALQSIRETAVAQLAESGKP